MKHLKVTAAALALLFGCIGAFATSEKTNALDQCATVPGNSGPSINPECQYNPSIQCCFISAGPSSQYVTQTQNGVSVMIRRSTSASVTIFGLKQ